MDGQQHDGAYDPGQREASNEGLLPLRRIIPAIWVFCVLRLWLGDQMIPLVADLICALLGTFVLVAPTPPRILFKPFAMVCVFACIIGVYRNVTLDLDYKARCVNVAKAPATVTETSESTLDGDSFDSRLLQDGNRSKFLQAVASSETATQRVLQAAITTTQAGGAKTTRKGKGRGWNSEPYDPKGNCFIACDHNPYGWAVKCTWHGCKVCDECLDLAETKSAGATPTTVQMMTRPTTTSMHTTRTTTVPTTMKTTTTEVTNVIDTETPTSEPTAAPPSIEESPEPPAATPQSSEATCGPLQMIYEGKCCINAHHLPPENANNKEECLSRAQNEAACGSGPSYFIGFEPQKENTGTGICLCHPTCGDGTNDVPSWDTYLASCQAADPTSSPTTAASDAEDFAAGTVSEEPDATLATENTAPSVGDESVVDGIAASTDNDGVNETFAGEDTHAAEGTDASENALLPVAAGGEKEDANDFATPAPPAVLQTPMPTVPVTDGEVMGSATSLPDDGCSYLFFALPLCIIVQCILQFCAACVSWAAFKTPQTEFAGAPEPMAGPRSRDRDMMRGGRARAGASDFDAADEAMLAHVMQMSRDQGGGDAHLYDRLASGEDEDAALQIAINESMLNRQGNQAGEAFADDDELQQVLRRSQEEY